MTTPNTIFAKVHGASTDVISGQRGLIGGWVEHERPAHVPYVRADLLTTARTEARREAMEAMEQRAANFDAYASDQRACIAKGWLRGRGIKDAEVRAEVWAEAAQDLRGAIRALIGEEG